MSTLRSSLKRSAATAEVAIEELSTRLLPIRMNGRPHGLPAPLILTLTSYGPRLKSLIPTLRRLLSQSIKPDRIELWVSEGDFSRLPVEVFALSSYGVAVEACENIGPHTKYYEARRQNPHAYLLTADDDVIYAYDMVEQLVEAHKTNPRAVVTHRSRRTIFRPDGPAPYEDWVLETRGGVESDCLMPMGVGGALYPPGAIPDEALDRASILRLSPRNDDIWLLWMVRRAGFTNKMVANPIEPRTWNGTQNVALWSTVNFGGQSKNDAYIRAMWDAFGPPERRTNVRG